MAKVLVVDGSPIAYQQFSAIGHLSTKSGEPTGLRFGFMRAIRSYVTKFSADRVVVCWDTPAPINKAEGVESYKANRVTTPEKQKMYAQIEALREMIGLTSWTQAWADGYEADDVVGTVARKLAVQGNQVIVATTDNDMAQLIRDSIQMFVPGKNARIKTSDEVFREFGVRPEVLVYWRAAQGDVSDNIQGISGACLKQIGDKFQRFLAKVGGPGVQVEEVVMGWIRAHAWEADSLKYAENLNLMKLHSPAAVMVRKGTRDRVGLLTLFERLEFKSLLAKVDDFTGGPVVG